MKLLLQGLARAFVSLEDGEGSNNSRLSGACTQVSSCLVSEVSLLWEGAELLTLIYMTYQSGSLNSGKLAIKPQGCLSAASALKL